jgi:ABC-2 type transport system ATP-binding protein
LLSVEHAEGTARNIDALRQAPGVRDAAIFGSALHVLVDDAARRGPELVERLARSGLPGAAARRIEPTLEDSFVHLVSDAEYRERTAA